MTRRGALVSPVVLTQKVVGAPSSAPVVNGAEHAWTVHDPRFPINPELAVCPKNLPRYDYSAEYLLSEMQTWRVDHVVISHVCYYGRNNAFPSYCVKTYPGKFAAIGLLVGHRIYALSDKENAGRLERLRKHHGLVRLRLRH